MSSVWGVTMFKDEEDVAEGVLEHMAEEGLTGIIVADNMSTDSTKECIEEATKQAALKGCTIIYVEDDEVAYNQSAKMTKLAEEAAGYGAEWIIPFDADEIWTSADRLTVDLGKLSDTIRSIEVPITNHYETCLDDPDVKNPFQRMEWRTSEAQPLGKIAFRWEEGAIIHQGNHSVSLPKGHLFFNKSVYAKVVLRHFPYRGFEHFKRKAVNGAKAYEASDLPEDMGAHWRSYGRILEHHGEDALREVYEQYFSFLSPVDAGLIHDPCGYRRWNS